MFLNSTNLRDFKRLLICAAVLLIFFTAKTKVSAAMQWRRFEDPFTGISLRYPFHWYRTGTRSEVDPELITTFYAPDIDFTFGEPADVEMRVIRTLSSGRANVHGLADGFQSTYLDSPHVYRAFGREDIVVNGNPAVQFAYTMLGEDETRYVVEVWQVFDDLVVNLKFSSIAQANNREDHYREIFMDMVESVIRISTTDTSTLSTNLHSLSGRIPEWADPRDRSNITDHELTRMYTTDGGLTVHYPEDWKPQPVYENYISESVYFSSTRRNALPFTVTITDLYYVFIANANDYTSRKFLSEKDDAFWLEVVKDAQIANLAENVPEFDLKRNRKIEVDGIPAILLEYRGLDASGEELVQCEVLMVDRRVLYSFTYTPGTTTTRTFKQMLESVELK